jgi:uncharacterized glyoxalase superfamily protein PhnB
VLEFYENAFSAEIRSVAKDDNGRVMHADIKIGDSVVMLSDEFPEPMLFRHFRHFRSEAHLCRCTFTPKIPARPS